MKKPSSTGTHASSPRKLTSARFVPGRHSESSPREPTNWVRFEATSPTALAVLDPAPPPGAVALRHVRFGYFKPEAGEVHVVGSFNGWNLRATPMRRDSIGDWAVEIELPPGEHRYRLLVDGEWRDDPSAQQTALNPFGGFDAIMVVV